MKNVKKFFVSVLLIGLVSLGISVSAKAEEVYCPESDGLESSYFTISGNLAMDKGTINYAGRSLSTSLKMQTETSIKFSTTNGGRLVIVLSGADTDYYNVKVDGVQKDATIIEANGCFGGYRKVAEHSNEKEAHPADVTELTVDVSAGTHTITKAKITNIYYISFVEAEPTTEPVTEAPTKAPEKETTKAAVTTVATTKATAKATTKATTKASGNKTTTKASENNNLEVGEEETSVEATSEATTEEVAVEPTGNKSNYDKLPQGVGEKKTKVVTNAAGEVVKVVDSTEKENNNGTLIAVCIVLGIVAVIGVGVFVFVRPKN